jgi:transposase-like protein
MSRIRYSAEVRAEAVSRVLDSHTPVAQVARDIGCTINAVHNWLKKHRRQNNPPSDLATFVPIKVIDPLQHSVEVVLTNGITIRLTDASARYIADLLHALSSC